jgi:hypothetical protein
MRRNWVVTCTKFKTVRELLEEQEKTKDMCKRILIALQACNNEIVELSHDCGWHEDFVEFSSELYDAICQIDMEEYYSTCEEIVNNCLKEMYNLCDDASVWLAI